MWAHLVEAIVGSLTIADQDRTRTCQVGYNEAV